MPFLYHSYIIRMWFVCHSYVIRMSSVCHLHVICMSSVCHSYVLVCHPYATRMYSYVTRMYSYATGMYSYVTRVSLVCTRMSSVCHSSVVLPWTFEKQKLNFSRCALLQMKTRVSLKYFVSYCRPGPLLKAGAKNLFCDMLTSSFIWCFLWVSKVLNNAEAKNPLKSIVFFARTRLPKKSKHLSSNNCFFPILILLMFVKNNKPIGVEKLVFFLYFHIIRWKYRTCQKYKRTLTVSFLTNGTNDQEQNKSFNPKEILTSLEHSTLNGFLTNIMTRNSVFFIS